MINEDEVENEEYDKEEYTNLINFLEEYCDISKDKINEMKEKCFQQTYIKFLIRNSKIPVLRNSIKPYGEIYAPIMWNKDYIIKLISKPNWGGYLLTITFWEFQIIDLDHEFPLDKIQELLNYHYPDDL